MPSVTDPSTSGSHSPVGTGGFRAAVTFDMNDGALWRRWEALTRDGIATAFQTVGVARPLLAELAPALGTRPFVVEVYESDGRHVLSLGLVLGRTASVRRIEHADFGLIDHAAPVWSADLDLAGERAEALRRVILAVLPAHDALLLAKQPPEVEGRPNPLALWPGAAPMHVVTMVYDPASCPPADLPAVRESRRKHRKLVRAGGAVHRVTDVPHALDLLDFAFDLRTAKARREGRHEAFEQPAVRDFYRAIVAGGLADGSAVVWEVTLGERTIAMVHGLSHRGRFFGTVMATDDDESVAPYSPGMITVATVLEDHVAAGGGRFDLGPGEHPYKLRFGGTSFALVEYVRAHTPLGYAAVADRALRRATRACLRRHPDLRTRVYRLLGRG